MSELGSVELSLLGHCPWIAVRLLWAMLRFSTCGAAKPLKCL